MEDFFLNLNQRIKELPQGRFEELREKLNKVYAELKISDKYQRFNRIFISEKSTHKMYALELKVICEVLQVSVAEVYDPAFSFLDAELRLRARQTEEIARKYRLKKAS